MATSETPLYSVIVPVYEHWHFVPALLERLQAQTVPQHAFEILLIDNGSTHYSPPEHLPANVQVHECSTPGSYAARNAGVDRARGELLVFTDADCLPRPDWLECIVRQAEQTGGRPALIAGAIEMVDLGQRLNAYTIYDSLRGIPQALYVSRGYAATANLAMPAVVMRTLGGFDTKRFSGGDTEFCKRAAAAGFRLSYASGAVVEHPARDSWQALVTKARRVKGAQLAASASNRRLGLLRTFAPPLFGFWRFLRAPNAPFPYRLVAVAVQVRIWGVEMRETVRLVMWAVAERR